MGIVLVPRGVASGGAFGEKQGSGVAIEGCRRVWSLWAWPVVGCVRGWEHDPWEAWPMVGYHPGWGVPVNMAFLG